MTQFIPGLLLCERFYHEIIHPLIATQFPQLEYSAGRLDAGSEVLGFDTPQSMDHDWGPANLTIFLEDADFGAYAARINEVLVSQLPHEFAGYSTDFPRDGEGISPVLEAINQAPVSHNISITTVDCFFSGYVGVNPLHGLRDVDWLLIPQQRLRTIVSGRIFHDGLQTLTPARDALHWYPDDIWRYLLACQWQRINQEEPFMARCGDVGDELGSRLVAARLINELMRLCFLIERQYWPYYKWFGTAFSLLECASVLNPIFHAVFDSRDWKKREEHLSTAYLAVARMHNALEITDFIEPEVAPFHERPYLVPHAARFVAALHASISADTVRRLPLHTGAVAQFVDSTDILDAIEMCSRMRIMYE